MKATGKKDVKINFKNQVLLKIYLSKHTPSISVKVDESELNKKLKVPGFISVGLDISDKIEVIITKKDFEKNKLTHGINKTIRFFAPFYVVDNCDNSPVQKKEDTKIQLRVVDYKP